MKTKLVFVFLLLLVFAGGYYLGAKIGFGNNPIPPELIKFHLENTNAHSVFVLTEYHYPYDNMFWFARLDPDGSLISYSLRGYDKGLGSSGWLISGQIPHDETELIRYRLISLIQNNPPASYPFLDINTPKGNAILTLSVVQSDPNIMNGEIHTHVMSCLQDQCPKEICQAYDLVNDVAERSGLTKRVKCPIP